MTPTPITVDVLLEEVWLDAQRLCRMVGVTEDWLRERVTLGLLSAQAADVQGEWRFGAGDLRRARRIAALEHHFGAAPELAALVADLEDELARLRAQLQRQATF